MYPHTSPVLKPRDLGLILSYRCQAACAHCLYNCGKGWHDWISVEDARTALINTKQVWGQAFQVHLTGGEPFLNFPLLLKTTQIAVELDIPVYVETNAAWCQDTHKTEQRFTALREVGMQAVLISVSPFHHECIPLQRTLDAITAARNAFGASRVIVYQADWLPEMAQFSHARPVPLKHYVEEYGKEQAGLHLWLGYGLISGGRSGYRLGGMIPKRPPEAFAGLNCREELLFAQHSHLDLYGNFIPAFCGGISLGSWHQLDQLVDVYSGSQYPPLVKVLIEQGPFGLYKMAAGSLGYPVLADGYAGKCHLCVDLRRHFVQMGAFKSQLLPQDFYQAENF